MDTVLVTAMPYVVKVAATSTSTGTPAWVMIAGSIVGGGVVGSLISTYVTSGREGRQARAKVRECLFDTENTRWTDTDYKLFREAVSRLEASALIARAPREIVRRYVYLAEVAHYTQLAKEKSDPGYPPRGLPLDLAVLVDMAIAILVEHLWSPWSKRHLVKHGAWVIDRGVETNKRRNPDFTWNVQLLRWKPITKEPGIRGFIHRLATAVRRRAGQLWEWIKAITPKGRARKIERTIPQVPIPESSATEESDA
jgi:hypothetical protein